MTSLARFEAARPICPNPVALASVSEGANDVRSGSWSCKNPGSEGLKWTARLSEKIATV
jgi:hypothetical protein